MPKAKTSSRVSSISKLSPFFRKRTDKPKLELHDYILASDTTSTSYPTFWADPEVLSQTSAYRIRRIGKLPSTLENVINMYSSQDVRVHSSQLFNCITIATPDSIYIYFYKKRNNDRVIHLSMEENQEPLIVNMVSNDTQTIGILAVSKSGHITYWKQYSDTSSFLKYKLSLSQQEQITAVESIRGQRAIIGSSHGNIYLVDYNANKLTVFSFYKQMNFATFLSNMLFVTNPVESRSSVVKSSLPCKGKVLRIRFSQGHAYIAYTEHMAVWNINDQNEIKLSTVISIHHHLKEALSRHIPSHVSRDYIKANLLDICLSENNTFTVLVSYSVPEMGNYVQYAVISLTYSGSILRENTPLWILHTASVPYSVIPDTLQRTPSLLISDGLAFVTFDRTMIAVSMDKNSLFEERVVLKQEEDDILCTQVNQTAEASALMITRKCIIEFQVDTNKIRRPSAEGNIYAVAVDDTNERDTLIFKSRLEQAVFFGVPEQGPLQFPLRTEQEDISKAVLSLTDDILKGCELLPKSLELGFYIESRYVFSNRIMSVLTDNGLIHSMTENERFKILKTTEYYYLAIVLYETLVENSNFTLQFSAAIQSVLQENSGDLIRAFLIDHPFDVNRLIEQFFSTFEVFDFNLEETALYLQKINTVILSLANRAYNYEEKYLPLYEISHHFGDLWMIASASDLLMKAFEKTQDYVCLSSLNNVTDQSMAALKDNLREIANLLLNHLSIEIYKSVGDVRQNYADKLSNTKSVIIQKLCVCQQYQVAIELAEKYNDLPAIVAALQTSQLSDEEVQAKHIYFIQAYGYDYFTLLLNWLNDHGEDEKILLLSKHVPDYVDKFFENNPVKISWTYYLLQENYVKALIRLKECLERETNVYKRCDMLSWANMMLVATKEEKDDMFESNILQDLSVQLEFEAIQMEIIEAFKEHLNFMSANENAAMFILNKCARILVEDETRKEDVIELKESIEKLLNETSLDKVQVIRILVMLDNFGSDVMNMTIALRLVNEVKDESNLLLSQIIWKEVYSRDLNSKYVKYHQEFTKVQRHTALKETYTWRVIQSNEDKILAPSSLNYFQSQELSQLENLFKAVMS